MTASPDETLFADLLDEDVPFEQFLTYRLLTLTSRLNRQAIKLLEAHSDLRLPEWRCLAMIGRDETLPVNRISEMAGMDRGLISRSMQGLVAKGYVISDRDEHDRRMIRASLTPDGQRLYEHMLPIMQQRQKRLLGALSASDRKAVFRIIECLNTAIDDWEETWEDTNETG